MTWRRCEAKRHDARRELAPAFSWALIEIFFFLVSVLVLLKSVRVCGSCEIVIECNVKRID